MSDTPQRGRSVTPATFLRLPLFTGLSTARPGMHGRASHAHRRTQLTRWISIDLCPCDTQHHGLRFRPPPGTSDDLVQTIIEGYHCTRIRATICRWKRDIASA